MKKIKIISLILMLFCLGSLYAQNVTITGKISDGATSEPLSGVSIMVKGSTQGTISDMDGNYSIAVSPGSVLLFNYLGYAPKEMKVGSQTIVNVQLNEDTQILDEVVVVGTVMKKSDLTGAVGNITAEKLVERPVTDINDALQGRVVVRSNRITPTAENQGVKSYT